MWPLWLWSFRSELLTWWLVVNCKYVTVQVLQLIPAFAIHAVDLQHTTTHENASVFIQMWRNYILSLHLSLHDKLKSMVIFVYNKFNAFILTYLETKLFTCKKMYKSTTHVHAKKYRHFYNSNKTKNSCGMYI